MACLCAAQWVRHQSDGYTCRTARRRLVDAGSNPASSTTLLSGTSRYQGLPAGTSVSGTSLALFEPLMSTRAPHALWTSISVAPRWHEGSLFFSSSLRCAQGANRMRREEAFTSIWTDFTNFSLVRRVGGRSVPAFQKRVVEE